MIQNQKVRQNIGDDMPEHNAQLRTAGHPAGDHIGLIPLPKHMGADHPRVPDPHGDYNRQDDAGRF